MPCPTCHNWYTVEIVNEYKYLGTIIDNQLNWSSNIRQLYSKCQQRLYFLRKLNEFHIDHTIMHMFYTSVIQSTFSFCILVYYGNASSRDIHKVHRIIRQAQKLTQCQCQSIQEIYNIVCTRKVRLIVGDEAHPLHQCYSKLRSGISRASAGRSSIRHWRNDLTNDEKKCNSFRQFDESIKSTYFK